MIIACRRKSVKVLFERRDDAPAAQQKVIYLGEDIGQKYEICYMIFFWS